jgi:hypothetical protein
MDIGRKEAAMLGHHLGLRGWGAAVLVIGALAACAFAQVTTGPSEPTAAVPSTAPTAAAGAIGTGVSPAAPEAGTDYREYFRPVFSTGALVWFGGLLWLLLAVDWRRLLWLRTLDVLLILALIVLFPMRGDGRSVTVFGTQATYAFVAWTGIAAIWAYLFLRTLGQVLNRAPSDAQHAYVGPAAWVLFAFVLSMNLCSLSKAEIQPSGLDAVRGGLTLRATGTLPYGTIDDSASGTMNGPLLYALHAQVLPAGGAAEGSREPTADQLAAAKWVGAYGHVLVLLGLLVLGWQFRDGSTGALLASLYGLLPPVIEQMATASATVPAALVLWALAFLSPRLRGWGSAIAAVLLVAACECGLYASFLIPAWIAFSLRRPALRVPIQTPNQQAYALRPISAWSFIIPFLIAGGLMDWYAYRRIEPAAPKASVFAELGHAEPLTLTVRSDGWSLAAGQTPGPATRSANDTNVSLGARLMRWLAADGNTGSPASLTVTQLNAALGASAPAATQAAEAEAALPAPLWRIRPATPQAEKLLADTYAADKAEYGLWASAVAASRTLLQDTLLSHLTAPSGIASGETPPGADEAGRSLGDGPWARWQQQQVRLLGNGDTTDAAKSIVTDRVRRLDDAHCAVVLGYVGVAVLTFFVFLLFASRCTVWHLCAVSAALAVGMHLWLTWNAGEHAAWYLPLVVAALFAGRARTLGDAADASLLQARLGTSKGPPES